MAAAMVLIGAGLVVGGVLNLVKVYWWPIDRANAEAKIMRGLGVALVAVATALVCVGGALLLI